jgi:hypothetical protein
MKSLREYIDLVNSLDQKQPVNEGAIGAVIGGGLGGIAGSALGPLGIVGGAAAGAALGSKAGDFISGLVDGGSRMPATNASISKDPSSPTGFTQSDTGSAVTPPKKGFMTSVKQAAGMDVDDLGVKMNGYKKYPPMIFSPTTSLKPSSSPLADIMKQAEDIRMKTYGFPCTCLGTWDYKGAVLGLFERDQYMDGAWADYATIGGIPGDLQPFFKSFGYTTSGQGDIPFTSSNKFGGSAGGITKFNTKEGQEVILGETFQKVAIVLPNGDPGQHLLCAQFLGPIDIWIKGGGQAALKEIFNSVELKGVKQLKG